MIRSLVTPQTNDLHIALPDDYIGRKVEVLVFAYDEPIDVPKPPLGIMAQFWGVISDETTSQMHIHVDESRTEWERDI